jgi:hypothetical protein
MQQVRKAPSDIQAAAHMSLLNGKACPRGPAPTRTENAANATPNFASFRMKIKTIINYNPNRNTERIHNCHLAFSTNEIIIFHSMTGFINM